MSELRDIGLSLQREYQDWLRECTGGQTFLSTDWAESLRRLEQTLDINPYIGQLSEMGLVPPGGLPIVDVATQPTSRMEERGDAPQTHDPANRASTPPSNQPRQTRALPDPTAAPKNGSGNPKLGWDSAPQTEQNKAFDVAFPLFGGISSPTDAPNPIESAPPQSPTFRGIGADALNQPQPRKPEAQGQATSGPSPRQSTNEQGPNPHEEGPNQWEAPVQGIYRPQRSGLTSNPNVEEPPHFEGHNTMRPIDEKSPQPMDIGYPKPQNGPTETPIPPQETTFAPLKGLAAFADRFAAQKAPAPIPERPPLEQPNVPPSPPETPDPKPPDPATLDPEALIELFEQRLEAAFRRFYG